MKHLQQVLISWGPLGMLLVAILDNAGPPSPGATDIVLIVLAAATHDATSWLVLAGLAFIGSLIGSAIFFEVIRRGGEKLVVKFTSGARGTRFRRWTQQYGLMPVFVSALVPVPLPVLPFKLFVACGAAMGVRRRRFLMVLIAARVPRYLILAYLGKTLGEDSYGWIKTHAFILLGAAAAIGMILYLLMRRADHGGGGTDSGAVQPLQ